MSDDDEEPRVLIVGGAGFRASVAELRERLADMFDVVDGKNDEEPPNVVLHDGVAALPALAPGTRVLDEAWADRVAPGEPPAGFLGAAPWPEALELVPGAEAVVRAPLESVTDLYPSPRAGDGTVVAVLKDGLSCVWDLDAGAELRKDGWGRAFDYDHLESSWSPDGRLFAAHNTSSSALVFHPRGALDERAAGDAPQFGAAAGVTAAAWLPDSSGVVADVPGSGYRSFVVLDAASGWAPRRPPLAVLGAASAAPPAAATATPRPYTTRLLGFPDGRRALVAYMRARRDASPATAVVFDHERGVVVGSYELGAGVCRAALCPAALGGDGDAVLATLARDGTVAFRAASSGRPLPGGPGAGLLAGGGLGGPGGVAWTADGRRVAAAIGGEVRVWDESPPSGPGRVVLRQAKAITVADIAWASGGARLLVATSLEDPSPGGIWNGAIAVFRP